MSKKKEKQKRRPPVGGHRVSLAPAALDGPRQQLRTRQVCFQCTRLMSKREWASFSPVVRKWRHVGCVSRSAALQHTVVGR